MTKEEIKEGEPIDPMEYTLVITSYKSLDEFLNSERINEEGKRRFFSFITIWNLLAEVIKE